MGGDEQPSFLVTLTRIRYDEGPGIRFRYLSPGYVHLLLQAEAVGPQRLCADTVSPPHPIVALSTGVFLQEPSQSALSLRVLCASGIVIPQAGGKE
jgi:hypothetical protein